MMLPGWANEVPRGIECQRCGAVGQSLPVDHKPGCIYNNSLVADGGFTLSRVCPPPSTDDLRLTRERERQPVNEFLEQRHPLGGVPGWKACFGARYDDFLVAVVVLGRPVARMADDGTELSITRFCRRDDRPANTGSWLIARARQWAYLEGYDSVSAHAGVAGNYGTVYEAAGFGCRDVTLADGSGWLTQGDDRDTWDDYERRKWVYCFDRGGAK